ncbi:MAG: hypothetical protein HZB35_00030 [Nitrospirae bacterium]|nr:hypothetical protein [Nitrospirota bacterium]
MKSFITIIMASLLIVVGVGCAAKKAKPLAPLLLTGQVSQAAMQANTQGASAFQCQSVAGESGDLGFAGAESVRESGFHTAENRPWARPFQYETDLRGRGATVANRREVEAWAKAKVKAKAKVEGRSDGPVH